MTADLIKRLEAAYKSSMPVGDLWNLCAEAADELERLTSQAPAEAHGEPTAWLVLDKDGSLVHAAAWRQAAHDHISDAITEHGIEEAARWVVRPAYTAPQPQPKGTEPPGWVCPELTPESMTDLAVAIGELSQAMGSPCVMGRAPQTIKSQTVRLAAFRLKEAQAPAPAPETADTRDEDDLHTIERAADLLEGYAAYIRNDGSENLQYHPYLPEVDMIAEELRMYATKRDVLAAELDAAIRERDEAQQEPWPEWTTNILKMVREVSGYDGYDDSEGVDVEEEVRELIAELTSQIERLRASQAPAVGDQQP